MKCQANSYQWPGVVVMRGECRSRGSGFESQDGNCFTLYCCVNCNVSLKRPKIKQNRGREWLFLGSPMLMDPSQQHVSLQYITTLFFYPID